MWLTVFGNGLCGSIVFMHILTQPLDWVSFALPDVVIRLLWGAPHQGF